MTGRAGGLEAPRVRLGPGDPRRPDRPPRPRPQPPGRSKLRACFGVNVQLRRRVSGEGSGPRETGRRGRGARSTGAFTIKALGDGGVGAQINAETSTRRSHAKYVYSRRSGGRSLEALGAGPHDPGSRPSPGDREVSCAAARARPWVAGPGPFARREKSKEVLP